MITELINALKAGQELSNKEAWKNAQATAGAVSAVVGATVMVLGWVGVEIPVSNDQLVAIGSGVAAVLGVFHTYTTVATSKSVGLQPKRDGRT